MLKASDIIHLTRDCFHIMRNDNLSTYNKYALLKSYLKISLASFLGIKGRKVMLNDYEVHFFSYPVLRSLVKEIFVEFGYYFESRKIDPVIIDCGANIGISIHFFKMIYPKSKIIGFEPDPVTYEKLRQNVYGRYLEGVQIHNVAVSDREETLKFYYDPDNPGSLTMSLLKDRQHREYKYVSSRVLSKYIQSEVDFLKIDVEGAEFLVIEELAINDKLKFIDEMAIEFHHHVRPEDDNLSKIILILEENGFGYQINTHSIFKFPKKTFQDIQIYAYNKRNQR